MTTVPGQALCPLLSVLLLALTAAQPFISLTGPSKRMTPGESASFNCTAGPFSSGDFNVTWLKDREEHPASAPRLVTNDKGNYSVTSKLWVTLTRRDVSSEIICEVTHSTLGEPLRKAENLSQVLQVVPTLKITAKPPGGHYQSRQKVDLTCHVDHFYPAHVHLAWTENGHKIQTVQDPQATRNPDGTYSLEHGRPAEATLQGSEFACWVMQDEQPPVKANISLRAQDSKGKGRSGHSHAIQGPLQRSEPGTDIQLTYRSTGFSSPQVAVTWFKNNLSVLQPQTSVHQSGSSYNVSSSVLVPLSAADVSSLVLCYVQHKTTLVFQRTVKLDQYLQVPPAVTISQSSASSDLVAVTCHARSFYPQNVHLTWLENCHTLRRAEQPTPTENSDGTFSLKSMQLVNSSAKGSERMLSCKVQQDDRVPIWASLILPSEAQDSDKFINDPGPEVLTLAFVTSLLGFKVLLVMTFTAAYIHARWKL